jgi:tetratricopeptide (TPR) repeat protein
MNQLKLDDDYNQLITFINERNYLEAENKSLELIKKNTHNTPLFFNLFGLVNQKLKKIDLAYKSFEKALALDSKFCPALFNLGMMKFETNFYEQAIFYFNKTLEVDPNNYDCNLMLAESYAKLRQFDHAIRNYEQTIKIDFKNKDAYINLANLFQSLDLNLEAQNTLEKAIKIIGEEYKLLNNLGLIYKKKNKIEEAISIFKKILITRIDDPEPYVNLSLSYFEKEDYVKSLEFIDKAITKSNYLHELFYYKSLTLEKIGKLDESLENIEKSILIREDYFNSIQKKIEIYIKLLKHADSKILIENLDFNNE